jgi:bifunctional pyridoxal-dependent enzyme with beta-cystathionase and maltose regulon repressor activities
MAISPKREAELNAVVKEFLRDYYHTVPKPKTVVVKDQVVRDADVEVSKADKNYPTSEDKVVRVRRPDYVRIDMAAYERQRAEKAAERQRRKWEHEYLNLDPLIWGYDEDEA